MFLLNFTSNDTQRPNYFEMVAQSEFLARLKPATQYMFSVLALRNPLWNYPTVYSNELFLLFQYFVEKHYLHYYQSSFAENFYNLRRTAVENNQNIIQKIQQIAQPPEELTPKQIRLSIFFLVVFPYLKSKIDGYVQANLDRDNEFDNLFENNEDDNNNNGEGGGEGINNDDGGGGGGGNNNNNNRRRIRVDIKKIFLKVYPYLNFIYEGILLVYQILYMHDLSRYFDFFQHYQRLELKRLTLPQLIAQQAAVEQKRNTEMEQMGSGMIAMIKKYLFQFKCRFFDYAPYLLPILFLAFRFSIWWYNEYGTSTSNKLVPPPPPLPSNKSSAIKLPDDRTICAICNNKRTNPAFLATSGFVFCYPCIYTHVNDHHSCPITLSPSSIDQIRKIYENTL